MPEIGLGIGQEQRSYQARMREWLYWYHEHGNRYLTPEEQVQNLLARLQQQGIDQNML